MDNQKEESQGRLKKQRKPFVMSPTHLFTNPEISSIAKTLWQVLDSKPDNWIFYWSEILKHFKEGRNAVKKSLKELEKFGYVKKRKARKGNLFCGMDIEVFYDPALPFDQENQGSARATENGSSENRDTENGATENGDIKQEGFNGEKNLNNTNSTNNDLKPPLPPTEEKAGFKKFEGGVYRLEGMLSAKALEQAKNNRHGWDWWYLCTTYIDSINNGKLKGGIPKDINKAFPAWILSYNKGKPPG